MTFSWDFPGAVFIVLHTSQDSPGLLPEILNRSSRVPVCRAQRSDSSGERIYVAPAGQRHMLLERGKILLQAGPRENRNRPSIDGLFRSAPPHAYGSQVVGVILTGNLDDGSAGLADIKGRGGLAIAQDPVEAMISAQAL